MKIRNFFIQALLCLLFSAQTLLAQGLNTRVTLTVKNASLAQVLQKMQHKYNFRFSYLNNEIPANPKFSAEVKDRPLSEVLDVLLEKTDLGYRENKGQIIIKKGFPKNKPKTTTFQKLNPQTETKPKPVSKPTSETAKPKTSKPTAVTESEPETETEVAVVEESLPDSPLPDDERLSNGDPENHVVIKEPNFFDKLKARRKAKEAQAAASDSILKNSTHFGFLYPISTNGTQANKYVNDFSAHMLVGTAAGLEGVEFAGVGNIDQCYVNGAQFAPLFNIVQGKPTGNIMEDSIRGNQSVTGAQFSGFLNVNDGNVKGGQFAGFLNTTQEAKGVQAAGFMNVARKVKGAQLAGFMNVADTISGAQAAGFLNIAKTSSGVQLGFINIADSVSGVSIGLLSLVKKGGYKHAEVFVSNDFDANLAYKIGVPKFHTIVALGAELEDKERWGYGTGFGAEWSMNRVLKLNTDLVSYQVIERSYNDFRNLEPEDFHLNLMNRFRLLGTVQIAKHFSLFGGPTFNVMVSQYENPDTNEIGSTIAPAKTFYDHTSVGGTNVKMWVGFNAGLRF